MNLFAISSIIGKFLINESGGPLNFLMNQLIIALPILVVISYFEFWKDTSIISLMTPKLIIVFFLLSLFAVVGYVSLLKGFDEGNVSVGGIILSSRVVLSVPLAVFILSESYRIEVYIAIVISIFGAIIVSWDKTLDLKSLFSLKAPGIRWYFLTTISWSFSNFMISYYLDDIPTFTVITIRQVFMIGFGLIYYFSKFQVYSSIRKPLTMNLFKKIIVYDLIIMAAQAGFIYGLSIKLGVSEAIGVAEGPFTLIYTLLVAKFIGNSVLQEPLDRKSVAVRLLGAIIAVLGTFGVIIYS
ncbi:MAG: EamA family transporter [Candidatus Heimdallarchaeota archaeon]|nr:EamA family transporter [Candidatus Heimdallarchaeota archaeon]